MGQKVSPNGLRIGINRDWEAKWYANNKDFSKYLNNDVKIRNFLMKTFKNAGISKIVIERNQKKCEVIMYVSKPGLVIGQNGVEIEKTKKTVSKLVNEEIQISVIEVKNPNLDAQLVADNIAHNIENRVSFRVAQKKAIRNTMKAGAKGIKTLVSGRLGGADIARGEGYSEGTTPLHTLRANIDYATAEADTTYGKIGVKVWIYKGEILGKTLENNKREEKKHMNNNKKGGNSNVNAKKN